MMVVTLSKLLLISLELRSVLQVHLTIPDSLQSRTILEILIFPVLCILALSVSSFFPRVHTKDDRDILEVIEH